MLHVHPHGDGTVNTPCQIWYHSINTLIMVAPPGHAFSCLMFIANTSVHCYENSTGTYSVCAIWLGKWNQRVREIDKVMVNVICDMVDICAMRNNVIARAVNLFIAWRTATQQAVFVNWLFIHIANGCQASTCCTLIKNILVILWKTVNAIFYERWYSLNIAMDSDTEIGIPNTPPIIDKDPDNLWIQILHQSAVAFVSALH